MATKQVSAAKLDALLSKLAPPFGPVWRRVETQFVNAAYNARRAPAPVFFRALSALRDAFAEHGEDLQPASHAQLALVAMEVGDWRASLDSMKKGAFDWKRQFFDHFAELGSRALEAGARKEAIEAFEASDSPIALVGRAFVSPKDDKLRKRADAALGILSEEARVLVFRACLLALGGDDKSARATLAKARSVDAHRAEQALEETRFAAIAGLA